jgi:hypothetical protein
MGLAWKSGGPAHAKVGRGPVREISKSQHNFVPLYKGLRTSRTYPELLELCGNLNFYNENSVNLVLIQNGTALAAKMAALEQGGFLRSFSLLKSSTSCRPFYGQKPQTALALSQQVSRHAFLGRDYGAIQ